MQDYKELHVWKKAHQFVIDLYQNTASYPKEEIYNLTTQIKRAACSIPANIAEGCGRFTQKDFASFLQNALGSAHEVEYFLLLSRDLGYITPNQYELLNNEISEVKAMLISFIKKVRL